MSAAHEKAAWVFVPPEAALENTHAESNAPDKHLATVIAQFALRGHAVHRLGRGFIVSKFGLVRHCQDFSELVRFARIVGATS